MNSLAAPPQPLSTAQGRLVWITAVVIAITRLWARSETLWDWDEAQFCLALRDYDVVAHQPHPPGFPLFVAAANLLDVVLSDFHALQAIVVASACLLFPLVFMLARELRFPFASSYAGAVLFVFFPNVWFYGGTAFSDVPGLVLVFAACVLLLRGCRNAKSYYAGALVLGLAAAVRPQALLVGCAPALVASWHRVRRGSWGALLLASAIGIVVIAVSYGAAAIASSSVDGYLAAVQALRDYVRTVDSFLAPGRPQLREIYRSFFVSPVPGGSAAVVVGALSLFAVVCAPIAALIRRRSADRTQPPTPATWSVWLLLATFLPFNVFGWLMLDIHSLGRYSIGYAAMYAILAAQAALWIAALTRRAAPFIAVAAIVTIALRFAWWTVPALQEARTTQSPPAAAVQWVEANLPPDARLYVSGSLGPFVRHAFPHRQVVFFNETSELNFGAAGRQEWYLTEGITTFANAVAFRRPHGPLFDIVRRRYFEVCIAPLTSLFVFGDGWYEQETDGQTEWRWMSGRGEVRVPPIAGRGRLSISISVPTEVVRHHPSITVTMNGEIVERFPVTQNGMTRSWIVASRRDHWNEVVLEIDRVVNPLKEGILPDGRDLGLQLVTYGWERVEE